jgi:thioredoxin-like negative regulator of GroEL
METNPNEPAAANAGTAVPSAGGSEVQEEALARAAELHLSWRAAVEHWEKCAATAAHEPKIQALTRKAYCLIELGQLDLASGVFASLSDHFEGKKGAAEIAVLQDGIRHADALWDECLARFPDDVAGVVGKSELLLRREMYEEAERLLARSVVTWPESGQVAALWARCATAAKNWEVAGARWKRVLAKWPSEREVRQGYIRYLAALGDAAAVNQYLESLAGEPAALTECALEYHIASDDFVEAVRQATKLAELEPHRLEHQLRLAGLLMREGAEPALHAALSILKMLYRMSPESVIVLTQFAEACIRSGFESQAQSLIQSIPLVDRRPEVEILRAWLQHKNNNEDAAKKIWAAILERQYVPAVHAPISDFTRIDGNDALQIGPEDILLFSVMRNEYPRLEWFLNYYRKLGIDKFVIVDNASSDESVKFLLQNPDVILYQTSDRYSTSGAGMRWINELIDRHGRQNWCLHVDADEAFVFPGQEGLGLRKLIEYLNWKGYEAALAVMLDMYPATVDRTSRTDLETMQSSYAYYDTKYFVHGSPICPYREIFGGVRRRLFRGYQLANKVPLINGKAGIRFLLSSHRITPAKLADFTAGLKHYHLAYALQPEYRPLFDEAIQRREFPSNSLERLRCRELWTSSTSDSLLAEQSARFESSEQLLTLAADERIRLPQPADFLLKFIRTALGKAS